MTYLRKIYSRFGVVLSAALFRVFVSFGNLIISLFVIRAQSDQLWGQMVYYLMILDFGFSVINWGHVPYLLRNFSARPSAIRQQFVNAVQSRFYILLIFGVVILALPWSAGVKGMIFLCALARFVYQSFEPIVQFERKFLFSVISELIGVGVVVIPIVFQGPHVSLHELLKLYTFSFVLRGFLAILYYRRYLSPFRIGGFFQWRAYLIPAFPFFLLTFTALFQQRADLYIVNLLLTPQDSARYQPFLNLLLFSQVGASLLLSPFVKNIFRLPLSSLHKLERSFVRFGVMFALLSTGVIYLMLAYVFRFELTWRMYFMAYVYIMLYYAYHIQNYRLQRILAQRTVALYSLTGTLVNLGCSVTLIPRFGIEGAAASGLITQALVAFLHYRGRAVIDRVAKKVSRLPA